MSFFTRYLELAVIQKQKWVSLNSVIPKQTALLAYDGKEENLGQDSDLRFVLKDSFLTTVDSDVYSEEGAMNFQVALGKYQNALEEFRARGTLDERIIGVELELQEEGRGRSLDKRTAMIAHDGKTLRFVVNEEGYSEEEAKNLQHALCKYQAALEALRSTGKVPGWLVQRQIDRLRGGATVGGIGGIIFGALVGGIGAAIVGVIFGGILGASGAIVGVILGGILGTLNGQFGAGAGVMLGGFVGAGYGLGW